MPDPLPEDEEKRLEILFRAAAGPVADDGFTDAVTHRVSRRVWRRRLVLTAAGAVGAAVALQPAWELSLRLGQQLAHLGMQWTSFAWVLQSPVTIGAGILVIAGPGVLQWLEE